MASLAYAILKKWFRGNRKACFCSSPWAHWCSPSDYLLRLSFTQVAGDLPELTPSAQMLLVLMHSVVATAAVVTLLEVDSWSS